MRNIKLKHQSAAIALAMAMPALVLLAGCTDKAKPYDKEVPTSNREVVAEPVAEDNSKVNVRDRDDATLTPVDQGNSKTDLDITQKIRKSLVSGESDYSTTAENIKIITLNGKVTLRGPVNTAAEKSGIVAIANHVAGLGNVDDQLEVKTNP